MSATGTASPPRIRYGPTLVVGLVGALAVTVGVAKPWVTATARVPGLPTIEASVTGADLAPLAGALGLVVLAGFGAVIATRGWVRRVVGILVVAAAAVVLVTTIHPPGATGTLEDGLAAKGWNSGAYSTNVDAWRWVSLAGALISVAAGAAISRYASRWATMGQEYDAPTRNAAATSGADGESTEMAELSEADVWREIDRGRDPTHRDEA